MPGRTESRQLTEAKDVTSGKELTFTIDTAKANLGNGWHTLTAKFVGSQNMAAQAEKVRVYIRQAAIARADVVVAGESFIYTGSPITPAVSVTLKNGTQLMKDRDYTLAYTNHTNAGTATVTVTGIGNYIGTAKKPLSSARQRHLKSVGQRQAQLPVGKRCLTAA